ncbi:hypothetical protein ABIC08_008332 [Bradyrhizobium sp. RT9b]
MHDAFAGDRRRQREQSKQRARVKIADFSLCLASSTRQHWFGTDNRPTIRDKISLSVSKVVRSLIAGDSKPSGRVQGDGVGHACRMRHQPGLWLYAPAQRTFGWHLSLLIARPKRIKTESSNLLRLLGSSIDLVADSKRTPDRRPSFVVPASASQVIIGSEEADEVLTTVCSHHSLEADPIQRNGLGLSQAWMD